MYRGRSGARCVHGKGVHVMGRSGARCVHGKGVHVMCRRGEVESDVFMGRGYM